MSNTYFTSYPSYMNAQTFLPGQQNNYPYIVNNNARPPVLPTWEGPSYYATQGFNSQVQPSYNSPLPPSYPQPYSQYGGGYSQYGGGYSQYGNQQPQVPTSGNNMYSSMMQMMMNMFQMFLNPSAAPKAEAKPVVADVPKVEPEKPKPAVADNQIITQNLPDGRQIVIEIKL